MRGWIIAAALVLAVSAVRADEDEQKLVAIAANEAEARATALDRFTDELLAYEGATNIFDDAGRSELRGAIESSLRGPVVEPLDAKKPEGKVKFTARASRSQVQKLLVERLGRAGLGPAAGRPLMIHVKADDEALGDAIKAAAVEHFTERGFDVTQSAAAVTSALHVFVRAKITRHSFAGNTPQVMKGYSGSVGVLSCTAEVADRLSGSTVASITVASTSRFHDLALTDADELPEPWFHDSAEAAKLDVAYARVLGDKVATILIRKLREKGVPKVKK